MLGGELAGVLKGITYGHWHRGRLVVDYGNWCGVGGAGIGGAIVVKVGGARHT
jgi:hypothetical protein